MTTKKRRTYTEEFKRDAVALVMEQGCPVSPQQQLSLLYAELHRLDAAGLDLILLELPHAGAQWDGKRDRLIRASAQ